MPKRRRAPTAVRARVGSKAAPASRRRTEAALAVFLRARPRTIAAALVALHVLLALLAFEPALHNGGDNAAYLALARSLLSGQGYRELYDPALPPHTQYPPVFPALLALLLALGFQPWVPFKLLVLACSAAAIALSYSWMRRKLQPEIAFAVALLMAVSPGVVNLAHWELSDVPFWTFTSAALLAWDRLGARNTRRVISASLLTLLAYFTRSAGLPLSVAAIAWLAWRRRWKQLAIFAALTFPLVFLWWLRARSQGGVDYVQQFWFVNPYAPEQGRIGVDGLFVRAWENTKDYFTVHLPVLLIGAPNVFGFVLSLAVGGLGIFGWARRLRHAHVAELFLPLYVGLILVWPAVWSGERFLVPALPLILFYAAEALVIVLRRFARPRIRVVGYATAGLIVLLGLPALSASIRYGSACTREYLLGDRYACHSQEWRDFYQMAELSATVLPEGSAVLTRKPRTFWALSNGVPSRNYPLNDQPDSLFATAQRAGARYVVLDRLDRLSQVYLLPVILQRPSAFCVLYALGPNRTAILGINPGADTIPNRTADPLNPEPQVSFEFCGPEYWRSPEVMEQVLRSR